MMSVNQSNKMSEKVTFLFGQKNNKMKKKKEKKTNLQKSTGIHVHSFWHVDPIPTYLQMTFYTLIRQGFGAARTWPINPWHRSQ